jgi:hypothetical protein
MDTVAVEKKFDLMGARLKVSGPGRWSNRPSFVIDIKKDRKGEFFDIEAKDNIEMMILDVQKQDRHLLLMVKEPNARPHLPPTNSKFLCGHDERNWFTCAIPSGVGIPVTSVSQAKQALKPQILRDLETREGLKGNRAHKRHRKLNSGRKIHRQGEFMFVPEPDFQPPSGSLTVIHRNEPMRRGAGNAHTAEYLYRTGGTKVYVRGNSDTVGLTEGEYQRRIKDNPSEARRWPWRVMVRDPKVYTKGKITHKEHRTLDLGHIWHRVYLNTEDKALGFTRVAFLD